MLINVGSTVPAMRFILALLLLYLGLFVLKGLEGKLIGILIAMTSLLSLYMVITRSCFVFPWLNIHKRNPAIRRSD